MAVAFIGRALRFTRRGQSRPWRACAGGPSSRTKSGGAGSSWQGGNLPMGATQLFEDHSAVHEECGATTAGASRGGTRGKRNPISPMASHGTVRAGRKRHSDGLG